MEVFIYLVIVFGILQLVKQLEKTEENGRKNSLEDYATYSSEDYKEKFLYKDLVFQKTHQQYSNGNDEIELSKVKEELAKKWEKVNG